MGYGATNMLPILYYHLKIREAQLPVILDDDAAKNELRFANLNVAIKIPDLPKDIEGKTVVVTALDHIRPIVAKLRQNNPRQIVVPLNMY